MDVVLIANGIDDHRYSADLTLFDSQSYSPHRFSAISEQLVAQRRH